MADKEPTDVGWWLEGNKIAAKPSPMTLEELIEMIREAKEKKSIGLDLRKKGLTVLPPELFRLPELVFLDLSGNKLTSLPPEILQLAKLEKLNLSENKLAALPPELFRLKKLKALGLGALNLHSLSPEIGQLKTLTQLYLHLNKLSVLPPEIGRLTNLQELLLWSNRLATLPPEIGQLTKLSYLCLNSNNLAVLPPEIGELTKLEKLCLNDNRLVALPQEFCRLKVLKKLDAKRNFLVSPPPEIIRNGIKAIQQYLVDLEKGVRPLNEVKLVFIGDGAAGKTSLIRKLLDRGFDNDEEATRGIDLLQWNVAIGGSHIRINIWDFGGQDVMHAEHQFFFSRRTLYVLVLDGRMNNRAEYWLQHIKAFGGNSPVLVVLNKRDSQLGRCNLNLPFLREKYPGIQSSFRTSCKTGEGITAFREGLLAELIKVGTAAVCWPRAWSAVKHRIEQAGRPWISCEEYRAICSEEGIMNGKVGDMLLEFLHDLGAVVHFKDICWDAMHALNPAWTANAVYGVVTAMKTAECGGIVSLQDMAEILPDRVCGNLPCPPETYACIIELMKKFELCCEHGKNAVLIPQLLPASEPDHTFDRAGSLRFILHYQDFLPPSIFPRFMVKAHEDIRDQDCWRSGMLLKDKMSGAEALIREDVQARRISIWVTGKYRKEYLHYLRFLLAAINNDFNGLKIIELLPVPNTSDITADCSALSEYVKNGLDKYIPAGSTKVYSSHELLSLVQPESMYELNLFIEKMDFVGEEKAAFASWLFSFTGVLSAQHVNLAELFREMLDWCRQKREGVDKEVL